LVFPTLSPDESFLEINMNNGEVPIKMKIQGSEREQYFSYDSKTLQHDFGQSIYKLFENEIIVIITDANFCVHKFILDNSNRTFLDEDFTVSKHPISEVCNLRAIRLYQRKACVA